MIYTLEGINGTRHVTMHAAWEPLGAAQARPACAVLTYESSHKRSAASSAFTLNCVHLAEAPGVPNLPALSSAN